MAPFSCSSIAKKKNNGNDVIKNNLLNKLKNAVLPNNQDNKVTDYINKLDGEFWLEPTECIKKNSEELVDNIHGSLEAFGIGKIGGSLINTRTFDVTEKRKIQRAIDDTQIQIIAKVITFLNEEVFTDNQNPFFVLIDELDTNWVHKNRKYQLIRALIEAIKAFKKIRNVKIIIALRNDLYERIISKTKDEGFQQEKYQTYLLPVKWDKDELFQLINKRINEVFKSRYTTQTVTFHDIAPHEVKGRKCFDYLYERTFERPRHIIMFINSCIEKSAGKNKFTQDTIKDAESEYSTLRKQAVLDEWGESYGFIENALQIIGSIKQPKFQISIIDKAKIESTASEINNGDGISTFDNDLKKYAEEAFLYDDKEEKFLANLSKMLYRIGIIGIKFSPNDSYKWAHTTAQDISAREISHSTSIKIHPMFWSVLGIYSKEEAER